MSELSETTNDATTPGKKRPATSKSKKQPASKKKKIEPPDEDLDESTNLTEASINMDELAEDEKLSPEELQKKIDKTNRQVKLLVYNFTTRLS